MWLDGCVICRVMDYKVRERIFKCVAFYLKKKRECLPRTGRQFLFLSRRVQWKELELNVLVPYAAAGEGGEVGPILQG